MITGKRRQISMTRRIAQALTYLRSEATAAALDEVAAAIAHAERSVSLICQKGPQMISEEAGKAAADGP